MLFTHTDRNPNIWAVWKFSDMHYSNYISALEAEKCVQNGVEGISMTPTALKQTPKTTMDFLMKNGIGVREIKGNGRPRRLGDSGIKRILAIRKSGLSFFKISNLVKVPKSTVFDYFGRYNGREIKESDIKSIELEEARRIFNELLERDIDDEISGLALAGQKSSDLEEIGSILKEIEIILYC